MAGRESMRNRRDNFTPSGVNQADNKRRSNQNLNKAILGYGIPNFVGIVFFIISLVYAVHLTENFLPQSKPAVTTPKDEFSAERASKHLFDITKLGPRTSGSYANDISAVKVLVQAIQEIKKSANKDFNVEIDVQTGAEGTFAFVRSGIVDIGYTIVYNNITNVVAKVSKKSSKSQSSPYILVNAHFDSVPNTEGASDDTVSCAVMLETMRAITHTKNKDIDNGFIFLFNGAEEGPLAGSHAFIMNHKWKDLPKVVVNLEAAGSGISSNFD